MFKILLLQGANANYLGKREPAVYGSTTVDELSAMLHRRGDLAEVGLDLREGGSLGAKSRSSIRRQAPGSWWTLRLLTATTWPGRRLGARTFWTKVRKTMRSQAPSTLSAASSPACPKAPSASIYSVAFHATGIRVRDLAITLDKLLP